MKKWMQIVKMRMAQHGKENKNEEWQISEELHNILRQRKRIKKATLKEEKCGRDLE